jgi:hypothetical protein
MKYIFFDSEALCALTSLQKHLLATTENLNITKGGRYTNGGCYIEVVL